MSSEINNKDEMKSRKERVNIVLGKSRQIQHKLESLSIKRKSVFVLTADLSDIYLYAEDIRKFIDLLIETPTNELRKIANTCVE